MSDQPFYRSSRKANTANLISLLKEKKLWVDLETCQVFTKRGELRQRTNEFGYPKVSVKIKGKSHAFFVHKIVWVSVHGAVPHGFEIDHMGSKEKPSIATLRLLDWRTNAANLDKGTNLAF